MVTNNSHLVFILCVLTICGCYAYTEQQSSFRDLERATFGDLNNDTGTIQDYICSENFRGFKINYANRRCVQDARVGCANPFVYGTMYECLKDFRGRGNICDRRVSPCKNRGTCSSVVVEPKVMKRGLTRRRSPGRSFKCRCENTGHYGRSCHKKCPKNLSARTPDLQPCISI